MKIKEPEETKHVNFSETAENEEQEEKIPYTKWFNSIPKNSRQNMINKVKAYFDVVPRKWADTYLYDKKIKKYDSKTITKNWIWWLTNKWKNW